MTSGWCRPSISSPDQQAAVSFGVVFGVKVLRGEGWGCMEKNALVRYQACFHFDISPNQVTAILACMCFCSHSASLLLTLHPVCEAPDPFTQLRRLNNTFLPFCLRVLDLKYDLYGIITSESHTKAPWGWWCPGHAIGMCPVASWHPPCGEGAAVCVASSIRCHLRWTHMET